MPDALEKRMHTPRFLLLFLAPLLWGLPPLALAEDLSLSCDHNDHNARYVLKKAPHGAWRRNEHLLVVGWKNGELEFRDKPRDDASDGTRFAYCEYSPAAHLHLIRRQEELLTSGVLLDNETGRLLPGGESVLISPDLRQYLAERQPDGLDGSQLFVFRADGSLVWQGVSGIADPGQKDWAAYLEDWHWSTENKLQAYLICAADINRTKPHRIPVTLDNKDGTYQWWPKVACQRSRG